MIIGEKRLTINSPGAQRVETVRRFFRPPVAGLILGRQDMFKRIANGFKIRKESRKLENWFSVTWDEEYIYRNVSPPGKDPWSDNFKWADIESICFEATDYMYSDDLYFFTTERPEGLVIPTEASGGSELWKLVIEKNLFDAELAIQAVTSREGFFCWPERQHRC